jgi:DNA polymerase-3 subunit epsilon
VTKCALFDRPLVILDLETTGTGVTRDRITEIGLIEVESGAVTDEWSSLVNPQAWISPFIEMHTGITNEMVAAAPLFGELSTDLALRLRGKVLVAHNARFDYGFLVNEFRRCGITFREQALCTVQLSRKLYSQERRHSLDALIDRFGFTCDRRHRAMDDARAVWQFLIVVNQTLPAATVSAAVTKLLSRQAVPPHLDHAELAAAPSSPGVYTLCGENGATLYVGKSVNIKERLNSHFSGVFRSDREMRLAQQAHSLEFRETAGELGALLTEARLIKEHLPIHNRRQRRSQDLFSVALREHPDGYLRTEVVTLRECREFGDLYGMLRTKREVGDLLRGLVDKDGLCAQFLGLEKGRSGACFSHQVKKCRGACVGVENQTVYNLRLRTALLAHRLREWPYPGPVGIREQSVTTGQTDVHVVDQWCYLGTATHEGELERLLVQRPLAGVERDTYRILSGYFQKNRPEIIDLSQMIQSSCDRFQHGEIPA